MRVKKGTIPAAFLPFDDTVTDPDAVVNVRDQHVFRQNHNALLAKRVRKDLVCQASPITRSASTAPAANHTYYKSRFYPDGEPQTRLLSVPLYLTQLTQQIRFWCRACWGTLDGESELETDPELYVVLREPQAAYMGDIDDNTITVSAANGTPTTYSVTVPVPPQTGELTLHMGRVPWILDVYCYTPVDNTRPDVGPLPLVDVDDKWFVVASSSIGIHDVVYSSLTREEPRSTVAARAIGGGNYKYFLDAPWTEIPTPGTHTITSREILAVDMYSWGVQELEIAAFNKDYVL